jgi:hypothetical protein
VTNISLEYVMLPLCAIASSWLKKSVAQGPKAKSISLAAI